jgi:uncharacterized membrane protein
VSNHDSKYFTVRRIALLAVMTALVTVGRLVFALPVLPNIQPMTALLILITLNIGIIDGLVVATLSMLLTNMILGMGPWTVLQIFAFIVVILLTALCKIFYRYGSFRNRLIFSIWAALTGFIYGLIISFLSFHLYGMSNFVVYYINGLPFDALHAVGNFAFFLILEPIIVPIIHKRFDETLL